MSKVDKHSSGGDDWILMHWSEWVEAKSLGRVSGKAESGGRGTVSRQSSQW